MSKTFLDIMADSSFGIDVLVDTSNINSTTIIRDHDHDHTTFAERAGSSKSR